MIIMRTFRAVCRLLANHCIFPSLRMFLFRISGISIGSGAFINMNFFVIDDYKGGMITIEPDVSIASNVTLVAVSNPNNSFIRKEYDLDRSGHITLKEGAWLGVNVVVLPGVTIGRGAVIGAGAVVTGDVGDFSVMCGVPAKKTRDLRERS